MTDLVLINPPVSLRSRYGALAAGGSRLPPLGLALLAAIARRAGHSVAIVDAEVQRLGPDEAAEAALGYDPRVIGLTAVTMTAHAAGAVARAVKAARPSVRVVLGGVHVTALPERTLEALPDVDVGVVGEGDETLLELLGALLGGGDLADMRGLVLRDSSGRPALTGERPLLADLDSLPYPAWDLLPGFPGSYRPPVNVLRALPASSLISSRGCPGRCTFCDRAVSGTRVRMHSAAYLADMAETLCRDWGVRQIHFHDDNFVSSPRRVAEFCELWRQKGRGVPWSAESRVDLVSPELLRTMRDGGCWQLGFGIETGSQELLDRLCKGITIQQARDAVRWCREAGIATRGFFMVGLPGETRSTLDATLDLMTGIGLDDAIVQVFSPYPGTALAEEIGASDSQEQWDSLSKWSVAYTPEGLTSEDVERARRAGTRRFYLRPKVIARYAWLVLSRPRLAAGLLAALAGWVRFVLPGRRASEA